MSDKDDGKMQLVDKILGGFMFIPAALMCLAPLALAITQVLT